MIISPSHTLEYKPNDIIITSSIGYVLLHNPNIIETIRHLDWLHLHGRWSLGTIHVPYSTAVILIARYRVSAPPPQFPSFYHSGRGGAPTVLYGILLYLALLRLLTAPAPRNGRLDFHHVTVSRARSRALECALLCRAA